MYLLNLSLFSSTHNITVNTTRVHMANHFVYIVLYSTIRNYLLAKLNKIYIRSSSVHSKTIILCMHGQSLSIR